MVRGAPVAKAADVHTGLVLVGDVGGALGDFGGLRRDEGYESFSLLFFAEDLAEQGHALAERVVKNAVRACLERHNGHAELLLQGVLFLDVLIFGDDDVGFAGENLLGFRRLSVGAADAAGRERAEHVTVGEHVGARNGIKHLGALLKSEVVDILNAAEQRDVADVAIHSECARADADDARIATGGDGQLAAYHVGNGDLRGSLGRGGALLLLRLGRLRGILRGSGLAAAGAE